jgi:hypothetical protein
MTEKIFCIVRYFIPCMTQRAAGALHRAFIGVDVFWIASLTSSARNDKKRRLRKKE